MKTALLFPTFLFVAAAFAGALVVESFQGTTIKKPFQVGDTKGAAKATASTRILYHGGPVMNISNSVYVIYYGSFAASTQPIVNDFLSGLNGSPNFGVNNSYNAGGQTAPVPLVYAFAAPNSNSTANPNGSVYFDNYSSGTQLGNSSVPKIVANAVKAGLPGDPNGVYLVVTSPDVKITGFCKSFCAYHSDSIVTLATGGSLHIHYALIPDPTQKCSSCNGGVADYGDVATPNGDMGADTMTDDIMHELSETVTDPNGTAWYTKGGEENGDLCNYVYSSPTSPVLTGVNQAGATYHYNFVSPSGGRYLVQLIWKNLGAGVCASN